MRTDGLTSRIFGALSASTAVRSAENLLLREHHREVDLNDGLQLETRGVLTQTSFPVCWMGRGMISAYIGCPCVASKSKPQ